MRVGFGSHDRCLMTKLTSFALGSLGGLLPILASLVTIDLAPLFDQGSLLTMGNCVGYGIRVCALLVLGGTMAALNAEVTQPLALVQLGIAAPALITSYINAAPLPPPKKAPTASLTLISPAQAGEADTGRVQLAGGWLSEVTKGMALRLDNIEASNRKLVTERATNNPASPMVLYPPVPSPPDGFGAYCGTADGRFGPGPVNQVGMSCSVPSSGGGVLTGSVTR